MSYSAELMHRKDNKENKMSSEASSSSTQPRRRPLRKGTKSCVQCRKKKIKCIFAASDPIQCIECFGRGTKCVPQSVVDEQFVVARKKNLRERVSRLEIGMDSLRKDSNTTMALVQSMGSGDSSSGSGSIKDDTSYTGQLWEPIRGNRPLRNMITSPTQPLLLSISLNQLHRDLQVRESISAVLQENEDLPQILRNGNHRWLALQRRLSEGKKFASLEAFAQYCFAQGTVYELAELALTCAYQSTSDVVQRITTLIDRLVLSDTYYMNNIQGIQTAVYQGNLQHELGQSKNAWDTWRKAMTFVQLLSLHTTRNTSKEELMWLALYTLDRNTSLCLGKPYSIQDKHCTFDFYHIKTYDEGKFNFMGFLFQLSQIAGRCTDHLVSIGQDLFGVGLTELEQQLIQFVAQYPEDFWADEPAPPKEDIPKVAAWRYRLIAKLAYQQIYLALFLPLLWQAEHNGLNYRYIHERCIEKSRNFLQLYQQFRQPNEYPFMKCRAFDTTACAATILIVLGLWSQTVQNPMPQQPQPSDWTIVQKLMTTLHHRFSCDPSEIAAYQSYRSLQKLHQTRSVQASVHVDIHLNGEFTIPFFSQNPVPTPAVSNTSMPSYMTTAVTPYNHFAMNNSYLWGSVLDSPYSDHSQEPQSAISETGTMPDNSLFTMSNDFNFAAPALH